MNDSTNQTTSNQTTSNQTTSNQTTSNQTTKNRLWIQVATTLGSGMVFIDNTVVTIALPVMQGEWGVSSVSVQWVVQAFALFLSSLILVGGSLGDQLGRKRMFLIGVVSFAIASIFCGLATNTTQLITAQAIKGMGGALLLPCSLAILSTAFDESERGRAIGTWSAFTSITAAVGPVLGGWLVENVSWRAVFFMTTPFAIVVVLLTLLHVPESRNQETDDSQQIDWLGALLATSGIGSIIYGLTVASQQTLTAPWAWRPFAAGIVLLCLFVWQESTQEAASRNPMMPLSLFRSRAFSGANVLTIFLYSALGALFYFLPFNLIQVQGYSPTATGAVLLPLILMIFALSRWTGGLVAQYGAKRLLMLGPCITAIGFALLAVPGIGGSYWTTFFPAIAVMGFGMAFFIAPLTTTVMNSVSTQSSGVASGINNAASRAASLLGIALFSIFMTSTFNASLDSQLAPLDLPNAVLLAIDEQRGNLAAAELPVSVTSTLPTEVVNHITQAIDLAFVAGYRINMLIAAALAVVSAFCAWWLIE
ncbi:MAG: MFS transporter [Chloroflexota bacterium]